jgi:thiosulfate/3-mercaptopyruvate sulfurtransferase
MQTNSITGIVLITFVLASCSPKQPTYLNAELLLTAEAFQKEAQLPNTLVIDARTSFTAWKDGHIPGSVYFHARRDLEDKTHPVEHFLVGPDAFQDHMQALGLTNNTRVLIYDEGNALGSARLFYALEYFGFEGKVSVLNGGFFAWKAAGLPESTFVGDEPISVSGTLGTFTSRVQENLQCDLAYVRGVEPGSNRIIVDARSVEEYAGTDIRAAKGGHIPGAVNLEWIQVLVGGDVPYFKSFQEIDSLYTSLGITRDKEVIPHCHTNVRGSHAYFTLRLMGFDSIKPYEGSWSEFGNVE